MKNNQSGKEMPRKPPGLSQEVSGKKSPKSRDINQYARDVMGPGAPEGIKRAMTAAGVNKNFKLKDSEFELAILLGALEGNPNLSQVLFLRGVRATAERRLKEVGLDKEIWKKITPIMSTERLKFLAADQTTIDVLRSCPNVLTGLGHDHWTGWKAAKLAAASNSALLTNVPLFASALGCSSGLS